MTVELVIFDCDGVLVDSEMISCRVDAACLSESGFPTTVEEVMERYVGISTAAMLADIAERHGRALPEDFPERLRRRVANAFATELVAVPGVAEALAAIAHRVCVASSSTPERLRHSLGLVGLWARFAPHVFSAAQVPRGKPAPDLFLFAAAQMGVDPKRCLVIEDSLAGVAAARAAGMAALGFCGAGHCRPGHAERLAAAGAALTFADMAQLPAIIAEHR
jgi:HAD superfamily hydrolase (TIGR01509 family)